MAGGGRTRTTSTSRQSQTLDPQSQRYLQGMRDRGMAAMNEIGSANLVASPNPALLNAIGNISGGGFTPLNAPTAEGVNADTAAFTNPYVQGVVDPTRAEFDFLRGKASMAANDLATRSGAFGGARHGVMEGARLGEIDRAQASQIANLMMGGYQNAQNAAFRLGDQGIQVGGMNMQGSLQNNANNLQAQSLGLQGAGMLQAIDQQRAMEPLTRNQAMLNLGMGAMGPTGWNSTGSSAQTQYMPSNTFGNLLGAGLTLGSMFFPPAGIARAAMPALSRGLAGGPPQIQPQLMGGPNGGYWGP